MELEEAFGITLEEDDYQHFVTPRKLTDRIFTKLKTTDEQTCQSQRAFYIIRRAVHDTLGLKRSDMRPDTKLRSLIPGPRQREDWAKLKSAVAARTWPDLERPTWMISLLALLTIAIFVAATYLMAASFPGLVLGVLIGLIPAIGFAILAARMTCRFRVCIPTRCRRLRDLAPYAITSDHVAWTREQISATVKRVVMYEFDLRESQYHEDIHFVEDLRM